MEENTNNTKTPIENKKGLLAKFKTRRVLVYVAFSVVGIVAGYMYYSLVGCNRGCSITSSPYLSMLWGGTVGFLLPGFFEKQRKKE